MMFIFCLFALTFAEKAVIDEVEDSEFYSVQYQSGSSFDLKGAIYLKYEIGKCHYMSATSYRKYEYTNNTVTFTQYTDAKCTQNPSKSEDPELTKKYKDAPAQRASKTYYEDDDKCTNEAIIPKVFYKDGCNKVQGTFGGSTGDKYIKFEREEGKLFFFTFSDDKCEKDILVDGKKVQNPVIDCDKCDKKYKTQCGSVATMILAIFAILAFFF